ncbi:MAG: S-layer homology domain-containing protein, partial [Deltaproteobacteria bacterium]|nr:S-layer homology domain-containing protein [Deltaproteobacteria bacterium]
MGLLRRMAALAALLALVMTGTATPAEAAPPPDAPTIVDWYEDAGEVGIAWAAPPSDGGSPITSYIIELHTSGQSFEVPASDAWLEDVYYGVAIYGLMNGWPDDFTVAARNADGVGPASAPVTLTPTGCADTPFYDVLTSHRFCDEIAWLFMTGITTGTDTGREIVFRPANTVSRQAMAAFLHRFFFEPEPTLTEPFFADVSTSHPFYDAIQWMAESGLSTGTPQAGGKPLYKPSSKVTRRGSWRWRSPVRWCSASAWCPSTSSPAR